MRRIRTAALALAIALPASVRAQDSTALVTPGLTPAQVSEAIDLGTHSKGSMEVSMGGEGSWGGTFLKAGGEGFSFVMRGPYGRIVTAAAMAAKRYQPFTPDSVTAAMAANVLVVKVEPTPPVKAGGRWTNTPAAQHIVLIPKEQKGQPEPAPVQPLRVDKVPVTWSNMVGGEMTGIGAVGYFDMAKVPTSDFFVVVVTAGKEYKMLVRGGNHDKLR